MKGWKKEEKKEREEKTKEGKGRRTKILIRKEGRGEVERF